MAQKKIYEFGSRHPQKGVLGQFTLVVIEVNAASIHTVHTVADGLESLAYCVINIFMMVFSRSKKQCLRDAGDCALRVCGDIWNSTYGLSKVILRLFKNIYQAERSESFQAYYKKKAAEHELSDDIDEISESISVSEDRPMSI